MVVFRHAESRRSHRRATFLIFFRVSLEKVRLSIWFWCVVGDDVDVRFLEVLDCLELTLSWLVEFGASYLMA